MKKKILQTAFVGVTFLAFCSTGFAQEAPKAAGLKSFKGVPSVESLESQADRGLDLFRRRSAEPGGFKVFALESPGQAAEARRGQPILHYFVRLDQLAAYQAGQDPKSLLSQPSAITYPLMVGSAIKGAVNLGWNGSQWKLVSVGGPAFMLKWEGLRQGHSQRTGRGLDEYFAVRIPALDEDFLGYENEKGELFLVPGRTNGPLGLTAGEASPAGEVFQKFAPVARNYHEVSFSKH